MKCTVKKNLIPAPRRQKKRDPKFQDNVNYKTRPHLGQSKKTEWGSLFLILDAHSCQDHLVQWWGQAWDGGEAPAVMVYTSVLLGSLSLFPLGTGSSEIFKPDCFSPLLPALEG